MLKRQIRLWISIAFEERLGSYETVVCEFHHPQFENSWSISIVNGTTYL